MRPQCNHQVDVYCGGDWPSQPFWHSIVEEADYLSPDAAQRDAGLWATLVNLQHLSPQAADDLASQQGSATFKARWFGEDVFYEQQTTDDAGRPRENIRRHDSGCVGLISLDEACTEVKPRLPAARTVQFCEPVVTFRESQAQAELGGISVEDKTPVLALWPSIPAFCTQPSVPRSRQVGTMSEPTAVPCATPANTSSDPGSFPELQDTPGPLPATHTKQPQPRCRQVGALSEPTADPQPQAQEHIATPRSREVGAVSEPTADPHKRTVALPSCYVEHASAAALGSLPCLLTSHWKVGTLSEPTVGNGKSAQAMPKLDSGFPAPEFPRQPRKHPGDPPSLLSAGSDLRPSCPRKLGAEELQLLALAGPTGLVCRAT